MTLQTVNIPVVYHAFGNQPIRWKRTWAWVEGTLAIHRPVDSLHDSEQWVLTHLPTGGIVTESPDKDEICARLRRFSEIEWHGIRVMNMPACELITHAAAIAEDVFGKSKANTQEWERDHRPYLEKAAQCR